MNAVYNHRYTREILEPVPFLSWYEAQIGGIRVFPTIKITVIRQVCMYCGLSVKINMSETPHGTWRSWTHFVCICFCVCGRQKPEYPQFEPHVWRRHYMGWYTRSGISLVYLCNARDNWESYHPQESNTWPMVRSTSSLTLDESTWKLILSYSTYLLFTSYLSLWVGPEHSYVVIRTLLTYLWSPCCQGMVNLLKPYPWLSIIYFTSMFNLLLWWLFQLW